jgi:hypothetical protein
MVVVRCTGACLGLACGIGLDWCWLRRLLESLLLVIYRNYARMSH